jgi:predicted dehydrogenase
MTRRDAARAVGLSAVSYSRILGANDKIGLGVIGTGGRGTYVMTLFQKQPEVDVRALCDVYAVRFDKAQQSAPGAKTFYDHRKLLELKEVDAVLIGSPDHWHKNHAVDAMNAGKDVYVEKPLCRTRDEAPQMVRAARVNNRVCQVGLQQRSGQVYLEPLDKFVNSGAIGRITEIDALWSGGVPRPLPTTPKECPSNLEWATFLGSVPYREWNPGMYFNFRAFLEFNGGKLTDFGHHWMDVVHMFMNAKGPISAAAAGGNFYPLNDGRTAPDTISALFEYPGFTVHFSSPATANGPEYGVTFYGDKGRLYVNRNRYEFYPAEKDATPVIAKFQGDITSDHVWNFLDCCKSRQKPTADVGIAAKSIVPPLLGVQSYIEKRRIRYDPDLEIVLPT